MGKSVVKSGVKGGIGTTGSLDVCIGMCTCVCIMYMCTRICIMHMCIAASLLSSAARSSVCVVKGVCVW